MGEAKRRGSYETRLVAAQRRLYGPSPIKWSLLFRPSNKANRHLPHLTVFVMALSALIYVALAGVLKIHGSSSIATEYPDIAWLPNWLINMVDREFASFLEAAVPPQWAAVLSAAHAVGYWVFYGKPDLPMDRQVIRAIVYAALANIGCYFILCWFGTPWMIDMFYMVFGALFVIASVYHAGPLADRFGMFRKD